MILFKLGLLYKIYYEYERSDSNKNRHIHHFVGNKFIYKIPNRKHYANNTKYSTDSCFFNVICE